MALSPIDLLIIAVYLVLVAMVGVVVRKQATKKLESLATDRHVLRQDPLVRAMLKAETLQSYRLYSEALVEFRGTGGPGQPAGLFLRGANAGQTLVLVDGVRLNSPYFGGYDWSLMPTAGLERVEVARSVFSDQPHVEVDTFDGLLVDYARRKGVHTVLRGLRAVSDFEYEFQMAMMNHHLNARIETFFMMASETYFYTASRLVKEVAGLGGNVSGLVSEVVHGRLLAKLQQRKR